MKGKGAGTEWEVAGRDYAPRAGDPDPTTQMLRALNGWSPPSGEAVELARTEEEKYDVDALQQMAVSVFFKDQFGKDRFFPPVDVRFGGGGAPPRKPTARLDVVRRGKYHVAEVVMLRGTRTKSAFVVDDIADAVYQNREMGLKGYTSTRQGPRAAPVPPRKWLEGLHQVVDPFGFGAAAAGQAGAAAVDTYDLSPAEQLQAGTTLAPEGTLREYKLSPKPGSFAEEANARGKHASSLAAGHVVVTPEMYGSMMARLLVPLLNASAESEGGGGCLRLGVVDGSEPLVAGVELSGCALAHNGSHEVTEWLELAASSLSCELAHEVFPVPPPRCLVVRADEVVPERAGGGKAGRLASVAGQGVLKELKQAGGRAWVLREPASARLACNDSGEPSWCLQSAHKVRLEPVPSGEECRSRFVVSVRVQLPPHTAPVFAPARGAVFGLSPADTWLVSAPALCLAHELLTRGSTTRVLLPLCGLDANALPAPVCDALRPAATLGGTDVEHAKGALAGVLSAHGGVTGDLVLAVALGSRLPLSSEQADEAAEAIKAAVMSVQEVFLPESGEHGISVVAVLTAGPGPGDGVVDLAWALCRLVAPLAAVSRVDFVHLPTESATPQAQRVEIAPQLEHYSLSSGGASITPADALDWLLSGSDRGDVKLMRAVVFSQAPVLAVLGAHERLFDAVKASRVACRPKRASMLLVEKPAIAWGQSAMVLSAARHFRGDPDFARVLLFSQTVPVDLVALKAEKPFLLVVDSMDIEDVRSLPKRLAQDSPDARFVVVAGVLRAQRVLPQLDFAAVHTFAPDPYLSSAADINAVEGTFVRWLEAKADDGCAAKVTAVRHAASEARKAIECPQPGGMFGVAHMLAFALAAAEGRARPPRELADDIVLHSDDDMRSDMLGAATLCLFGGGARKSLVYRTSSRSPDASCRGRELGVFVRVAADRLISFRSPLGAALVLLSLRAREAGERRPVWKLLVDGARLAAKHCDDREAAGVRRALFATKGQKTTGAYSDLVSHVVWNMSGGKPWQDANALSDRLTELMLAIDDKQGRAYFCLTAARLQRSSRNFSEALAWLGAREVRDLPENAEVLLITLRAHVLALKAAEGARTARHLAEKEEAAAVDTAAADAWAAYRLVRDVDEDRLRSEASLIKRVVEALETVKDKFSPSRQKRHHVSNVPKWDALKRETEAALSWLGDRLEAAPGSVEEKGAAEGADSRSSGGGARSSASSTSGGGVSVAAEEGSAVAVERAPQPAPSLASFHEEGADEASVWRAMLKGISAKC